MLRDFGLVTVIDLTVSLLGVLAVLPAVLTLAERRVPTGAAPRRAASAVASPARRHAGREAPRAADRRLRGRAAHVDHVQHDRHRVQGLARAAGGRRRCRRSRCRCRRRPAAAAATPTWRPSPSRARPARGRRARCAGATSSTRASWPRTARSCSRSSFTRSRAASTRSRRSSASPPATATSSSGSSPSAPTPPRRARCGSNLPVGYDHDGAVANEYAVVVCPTITYVAPRRPRRRLDGRPAVRSGDRVVGASALGEPAVHAGEVEAAIAAELPGLGLRWCEFAVAGDVLRRSPPALRERLRGLSDRHRGATAIALRSRSIPHAYRALFRHLGLEPDEERIPVEALMLERLKRGAYRSRGLLAGRADWSPRWTPRSACGRSTRTALEGAPRLALEGGRIVVADDARRDRAAVLGAAGGDARRRAGSCSTRSPRRACRRSRSRRRCWSPGTSSIPR